MNIDLYDSECEEYTFIICHMITWNIIFVFRDGGSILIRIIKKFAPGELDASVDARENV